MGFDDTKMDSFALAGIATILVALAFGMHHLGFVTISWVGFGVAVGLVGYACWLGRPWHRLREDGKRNDDPARD